MKWWGRLMPHHFNVPSHLPTCTGYVRFSLKMTLHSQKYVCFKYITIQCPLAALSWQFQIFNLNIRDQHPRKYIIQCQNLLHLYSENSDFDTLWRLKYRSDQSTIDKVVQLDVLYNISEKIAVASGTPAQFNLALFFNNIFRIHKFSFIRK